MGKKSRKQKSTKPASAGVDITAGLRGMGDEFTRAGRAESFQKMAEMDRLTLQQQKDTIRQALIDMGTDVSSYDDDPTGDGDQSMIETEEKRDAGRELYSIGGDIHVHLTQNAISQFALWCAMGCAEYIDKSIQDVARSERKPYSRSEKMRHLLESRETSLRLTPLLLIVSAGKNIGGPRLAEMHKHKETAKILLKYGASPVAKDVLGKTVCHYGAGTMATDMTLEVADLCIQAAKSHNLFGKDVCLHGLQTQVMNGRIGIAGGFDCDSGRRSVYLPDDRREIWIKPDNMKLSSSSDQCEPLLLTNVQDRFGSVSLHEVMMSTRVDVAEFLLKKHNTCIHTKDMDGISPVKHASGMGQAAFPDSRVIMEVARHESRKATKERKGAEQEAMKYCTNCSIDMGPDGGYPCSRCKVPSYCGRECQLTHWPDHKKECKILSGIKLDPPLDHGMHSVSMPLSGGGMFSGGAYQKPNNVDYDKKFTVKIQAMVDDRSS